MCGKIVFSEKAMLGAMLSSLSLKTLKIHDFFLLHISSNHQDLILIWKTYCTTYLLYISSLMYGKYLLSQK